MKKASKIQLLMLAGLFTQSVVYPSIPWISLFYDLRYMVRYKEMPMVYPVYSAAFTYCAAEVFSNTDTMKARMEKFDRNLMLNEFETAF